METTERIVEAYVRYVKGWATIPNIKCPAQKEIDLLAIDPATLKRYHIEIGVSISGAFSKLTDQPFDAEAWQRRRDVRQTRTVGYYVQRKFEPEEVVSRLREFGFEPGGYTRIIATWGWTPGAEAQAEAQRIKLWDFRKLLQEIVTRFRHTRAYFTDDTLRTLQLFERSLRELGSSPHEAQG